MSYQEDRLTEIADAIRVKDGTTAPIKATDFAARILALPSGGGVEIDEYYYRVVQLTLITADRLQYLDEAWESRHQITVDANGNVTGVTGTLNDIVIPKEALRIPNTGYTSSPFYPHRDSVKSLTLPNGLRHIGNYAFQNCSSLTGSLIIPNSVTRIGTYAFYHCSGFTGDLIIPNSITSIGERAFQGCSGFTGSLTIPNSITSISNAVFYGCSGFTGDLTIPNSITSIDNSVFRECSNLIRVVFEGQAPTLNSFTFYGCTAVLEYDFTNCTTVPTLSNENAFRNINANCIMKVPAALEAAWKAATNWVTYADYIVGV
ncbi:MAG TPA: leucine-rich repeat domain-containing protein [Clostridiales bacterium]|nr:leucine-rich repeat domain-containing protein [Clostridiales bacterium]